MGFSVFFTSASFRPPQKVNFIFSIPAFHVHRTQTHFSLRTYPISNYPNSGLVDFDIIRTKKTAQQF